MFKVKVVEYLLQNFNAEIFTKMSQKLYLAILRILFQRINNLKMELFYVIFLDFTYSQYIYRFKILLFPINKYSLFNFKD